MCISSRPGLAVLAFVLFSANAAHALVLPSPGNPLTSQQYQDFTIYSLPYLDNLLPGDYSVDSSPGKLHDKVVIVTGNSGAAAKNDDDCGTTPTACDDAYDYPSSSVDHFTTGTSPEPDPAVPGEPTRSTWTAQVSGLRSYLGGEDLVLMFNLNEDVGGDENTLDGQSLLVAAKVDLTDASGTVQQSFYLGANNVLTPLIAAGPSPYTTAEDAWVALGEPEADSTNVPTDPVTNGTEGNEHYVPLIANLGDPNGYASLDPRWAYVHGRIGVDSTTGDFLGFGSCTYLGLSNCTTINQNIGADEVAFAAFNQELSDLVNSGDVGTYAYMNVDVITAGQSNGFEQLFITKFASVSTPGPIPEPTTLALLGLGLAGVGFYRRRKQAA